MSDPEREFDALLASLRDDPLPEGMLETVRAGVRTRIASGRRGRAWTGWLALAAAAAVVVVLLAMPPSVAVLRLAAPRAPEVVPMALVRPPLQPRPAAGAERPWGARAERRPVLAAAARRTPEPREIRTQFMRIVTGDPNVVILWAMNSDGETR